MLTDVHLALFALVAIVSAVLLVVAVLGVVRNSFERLWIDRLILADLATLALTTVVGPLLLVAGHQPQDGLHFLYAALAWLMLPAGRYAARTGSPRRRAGAIALASAILLGVLLRLYMTGAGS